LIVQLPYFGAPEQVLFLILPVRILLDLVLFVHADALDSVGAGARVWLAVASVARARARAKAVKIAIHANSEEALAIHLICPTC
jgi:hypothetical protein